MSPTPQPFSELILASTSSARRVLMDSLRVPYRAVAPGVDEQVSPELPVAEVVSTLARRKALAVSRRFPEALVIGSDQLVAFEGEALGKPGDRAQAREQLARLSGNEHQIVTGLCLLGPGVEERQVEIAHLRLYRLAEDELERYLELDEWRGCAGGYRIEGAGQALFAEIDGDRTNVQGLPMVLLVRLLRKVGWRFF